MKIKEVMILDLTSVSADTPIKEAVKIMSRQRMVGLPVVDNDQNVIGIITESDIVLDQDLADSSAENKWEVFCFGTLAQRTKENREVLSQIISQVHPHQVFYDLNLRQNYYKKEWIEKSLCQSSIVKLNDREALIVSELLFDQTLKQEKLAEFICREYDLSIVCITHGKNGSSVYRNGKLEKVTGINGPVADTVGGGDSYSAGFLFSYLCGTNIYEAAEFAEIVGNFVVSQSGAVPKYPKWLEKEIVNLKYKIKK